MKQFRSTTSRETPTVQFASSGETSNRAREVQILVNLIEPDPRYQPSFISDEAGPMDICNLEEIDILNRLSAYFSGALTISLRTPLWRLVDELKAHYPWWPDDRPWER